MNRDARRAAVIVGLYSPPDPNPDSPAALAAAALRARIAAIACMMREIGEVGREVYRRIGEFGRRVGETFRRAGLLKTAPPDDPRARALWHRQHRNTGPTPPVPAYRRFAPAQFVPIPTATRTTRSA